jgi:sterol desaturase/sphingolipid hydroxylase (fatty acid hydroxylase superfamily)
VNVFAHTLHDLPASVAALFAYATVAAILGARFPARRDQPFFRRDLGSDLLHSFLNPLIAAPIVTGILLVSGLLDVRPNARLAALPFPVQALAALFVVDLVGYWRHRLLHTRFGWPFHAVHHSSRNLDWLSNDRVELGELITTNTLQAAALLACGFSPELIAVNAALRRAYGFFIHMNVKLPWGPLRYVLVSPTFHRWHHSCDPRAQGKNYATFFAAIDLLFGTWFSPVGEEPEVLGTGELLVPEGYVSQVAFPWLAKLSAISGQRSAGPPRSSG